MEKKTFVLSVLVLTIAIARAQSDEWHESDNWRLYGIGVTRFSGIRLSSLDRYRNRPLNEDSMRAFMAHPTRIAAGNQPAWKEAYVASCELDEVKRKVDLSVDGTFFFDEYDKTYFQVPPEIQKAWAAYLADSFRSLASQK